VEKYINKIIVIAVVLIFISAVLLFGYHSFYFHMLEAKREQTGAPFEKGNIIIAALTKYKSEEGKYPENLQELVPKYLNPVPDPDWGTNEWFYVYEKKYAAFYLEVQYSKSTYASHHYYSAATSKENWSYDW